MLRCAKFILDFCTQTLLILHMAHWHHGFCIRKLRQLCTCFWPYLVFNVLGKLSQNRGSELQYRLKHRAILYTGSVWAIVLGVRPADSGFERKRRVTFSGTLASIRNLKTAWNGMYLPWSQYTNTRDLQLTAD